MKHVHFWTLGSKIGQADFALDGVNDWDPDLEPGRYLSGFGHAFIELYVRLARRGEPVSIGRIVPREARVVVVMLAELTWWHGEVLAWREFELCRALLGLHIGVVSIRADIASVPSPRYTALEVMPSRQAVRDVVRQEYLPLLPQRGLVPRDPRRGERVESVATKIYSFNRPVWLDDKFVENLSGQAGCRLRVDTELDSPNRWPDFSDVDIALCFQPESVNDVAEKPPTKLINAWYAGAIPICGHVASYIEEGSPGRDMLLADGPVEIMDHVVRLRSQPEYALRIFRGVEARRDSVAVDAILDTWWNALQRVEPGSRRLIASAFLASGLRLARSRLLDGMK